MAKKLKYNYTFDASAKTITVDGYYPLREFQLITNTTDNIIIYNFANPSLGGSVSYNSTTEKTTITLTYDTTSMSDEDELQIFVDIPEDKIDFSETFVDPVSKLRVSNPENLIDTDFEYGLQPTKWETVELVNNIPSVYSRGAGVSLANISSMQTTASSEIIDVTCGEIHELSVGDPIEVQGTASQTANGKYIVTSVESTTKFSYRASGPQATTKDIKTAYTVIIPGAFFSGSNIEYDKNDGIATDGEPTSVLTINTENPHGFSTSTSLYITNTVGKKSIAITTGTDLASDGVKFISTSTDTPDSAFFADNHGLYNNQTLYVTTTGTFPATGTNSPQPGDSTGESDIQSVYDAVVEAAASMIGDMGTDHTHILMNYNTNTTFPYYFNGGNTTDGGTTSYQDAMYGHYLGSSNRYAQYDTWTDTNLMTQYRWYNYGEGNTVLYTGSPVDIGAYYSRSFLRGGYSAPTTLANKGLYMISTPHQYNQYTDYIITVRSYPKASLIEPNSTNAYTYDAAAYYSQRTYAWYLYYSSYYVHQNTRQNGGDGWYYTYRATYYDDSYQTNRAQFIKLDVMLWNENWDGFYGTNSSWFTPIYRYERTLGGYDNGRRGSHYHIEVLLAVKDNITSFPTYYGSSGSKLTTAEMATYVVNAVKSKLQAAQFQSGINTVRSIVYNNDRFKIKNLSGVTYEFRDSGIGTVTIETGQTSGIVDNYYDITGVTSTSLQLGVGVQIADRVLEFSNTGITSYGDQYYAYIDGGHGLSDGQKLTYTKTSGADIPGVGSGQTYYAITTNADYLQLAYTKNDWSAGINSITDVVSGDGEYTLSISGISGRVAAAGTITFSSNSKVISGQDTRFTATYTVGDQFITADTTGVGTYSGYITGEVASISNDTSLTLTENIGVAATGVNHYIDTKVNVRADGEFLHRPFDGGVDITAGTSADSKIIRQTRKYFRYQSGKGIQCSMAINFNPYRPARTLTRTGDYTANVTTEYPHGLVVGNSIKVRGAEIVRYYSPSDASYDSSTGLLTITSQGHQVTTGEYITLRDESFRFTCAKDNHATNHDYPRASDPAGSLTRLEVLATTSTTFTVDVGTSTYVGAHTFIEIIGGSNAVTHYDTSNGYNGTFDVASATDFGFTYTMTDLTSSATPSGFFEYTISRYANAAIRAGLFDDQNGMFYEYDGKNLHCVRRSSTQQLAGTVRMTRGQNSVLGTNTKFTAQLKVNDYIVIRGQSYKVSNIESDDVIYVQPKYKGNSNNGIVVTKTEDVRVKQSNWNIDKADGTGPSGYNLDINAIQMAYMDYSWYGAGKIRFGFKDRLGHVKYMHEFLHNNRLNEAYMRTGNVPARYEVVNKGIPTFVPSLFHWGTSVIMDGGFDDDDSYLFTASGNTLTFTNGASNTGITTAASSLYSTGWGNYTQWYLNIPFHSDDASKFTNGIALYTEDDELSGETVSYTTLSGSVVNVRSFLQSGRNSPAVYPNVGSGTTVSIGAPYVATTAVELTDNIPLISIRLSPSCDNNLIGAVGERDIINRMQLKMQEMGISVSHDCRISVILNGKLSNLEYSNVGAPSLSQYIAHTGGDTVSDGITIYQFRASGGSIGANGERTVASQTFDLSSLIDLGNSILGGDNVFPDGPDIITIAASVLDTTTVNQTSPFQVSSRISWAESQA